MCYEHCCPTTTLTATQASGSVNPLLGGGSLTLNLHEDGTTTGRLFAPGAGETGEDLDVDLRGEETPFYLLRPEVAGGWGPNIQAHRDTHPPIVTHMHYEFEGWLGDDLLTTFPEFVVTERLAAALETSKLTGFRLAGVELSAGGMWEQLYHDRPVPHCRWLQVTGRACQADLGKTVLADLVVSPAALELLRSFTLSACTVQPWTG